MSSDCILLPSEQVEAASPPVQNPLVGRSSSRRYPRELGCMPSSFLPQLRSNGRCLELGNIRQTLRGDLLQHGMDIHLQHVLWFHDRAQDDRPLRGDFNIDKVSEERPAVFRMTEGMRTPALFPHFVTVIDMASICDG